MHRLKSSLPNKNITGKSRLNIEKGILMLRQTIISIGKKYAYVILNAN